MKKYYIMKVEKKDIKNAEKVLFNCLIDRMNLCTLIKLIELSNDESHAYFVVGGEQFSCKRVLSIAKKVLSERGLYVKIFSYDSIKGLNLDSLIWYVDSNQSGSTIKSYYNNPLIQNHLKKMTTKFILHKGLLSNHVFCTDCDGFADPVELTSLKGVYKCSFCDAEVIVEGPLLTGKKPVNHLSKEEQLYLIGLPSISPIEITVPNDIYQGEQITIPLIEPLIINSPSLHKRRRTRLFTVLDTADFSQSDIEQISWDIIV